MVYYLWRLIMDLKYQAQELAERMAEEQHHVNFYDLPDYIQGTLYSVAYQEVVEHHAAHLEHMRDTVRDSF